MAEKVKVPFGTISIPDEARQLIDQALDAQRVSSGKYVRQFEDRFAELLGVREAVAVSSGTDADVLALAVLHDYGAQRGDEVIVPALSFVATGNAVVHAGFKPVFVDVDRDTLNIDPEQVEPAITDRTLAIMPVHLMGKPAPMDEIDVIAKRHDLRVIEDAAEAHGGMYRGRPIGSLSDLSAFSLYVAHIVTTGEGGVVATDHDEMAGILRSLRSHGRACKCRVCTLNTASAYCPKRFQDGQDIRFHFERIGYSCKMNEIEAAIGLGNLSHYDEILSKRRRNLLHALEGLRRFEPFLGTIHEEPHEQIGPHAIPIVVQEEAPFTRSDLTSHLEAHGIETRTLFGSMPTQCPGFAYLGHRTGEFPNAEYIGLNGLHIGVHQDLGPAEIDYVLDTVGTFIEQHQA